MAEHDNGAANGVDNGKDGQPERLADGRFGPGYRGGPGRPAIPPWLRERTDKLLRLLYMAATTGRLPLAPPTAADEPEIDDQGNAVPMEAMRTQIVPAKVRIDAGDKLLDRLMGRAPLNDNGDRLSGEELAALLTALATGKPPTTNGG